MASDTFTGRAGLILDIASFMGACGLQIPISLFFM